MVHPRPTVLGLAADLAEGRTTSRALGRSRASAGLPIRPAKGERGLFRKVYPRGGARRGGRAGSAAQAGYVASPLAGLPVSIKDLFDVTGERTLAGSRALDDAPAGGRACDAPSRRAARRRGGDRRPHQHDRVRLFRRRHQSALRHARQSLRSQAHPRRLHLGSAVSVTDGHAVACDRHRYRRLRAHSRRAVRAGRLQADATARPAGRRDAALDDARFHRAARPSASAAAPSPMPCWRARRRRCRRRRSGRGLRLAVPRRVCSSTISIGELAGAFERASAPVARRRPVVDLPLAELGEHAAINAKGGFRPRGLCLACRLSRAAAPITTRGFASASSVGPGDDGGDYVIRPRSAIRLHRPGRGAHGRVRRAVDADGAGVAPPIAAFERMRSSGGSIARQLRNRRSSTFSTLRL